MITIKITPENLSDRSKAWNLHINNVIVPCISEDLAVEAAAKIALALEKATNETVRIY